MPGKDKIRGIVFDKDGTLFGFNSMWALWCDRVLAELSPDDRKLRYSLGEAVGYDPVQRQFTTGSLIVNASADETIQTWCELLSDKSFAAIESIGRQQLGELPSAVPVTDLDKLCNRLKSYDIKLGVATNDFESVARDQLKQIDAISLFDFICGFDSGYGAKPDPGMILGFCEKTGLQTVDVAMVGDSCHDLDAGRAAGAGLLVGVLTGPARHHDLVDVADVILDDVSQLPEYLGVTA